MNEIESKWNKWDLHLHTPFTKLNNGFILSNDKDDVWDHFCEVIENSDVKVFGITDYFSSDNYFTFIKLFNEKYPHSNKLFFPNIEFRLEVSVNKSAEEVNLHVIFSNLTDKGKIETFLQKLDTNIRRSGAVVSCKDLNSKIDFESAGVDYRNLERILKEVFGKEEPYIIIAASNNAGLRPDNKSPRKLNLTDEIDKICDGFFGGSQNIEYYLKVDRYESKEIAKKKAVFACSDAHSFNDLEESLGKRLSKNNSGNLVIEKDITWIKSECTFDGLKQVLFEPDTRIYIGETKPPQPTNIIESIIFNIPSGSNITVKSGNVDRKLDFCFAGLNKKLNLSPYFNCFIGGRGSGKSTILNFLGLHSKDPTLSKEFWSKMQPSFIPSDLRIFNFNGIGTFEYIGQSEVESFAVNKEAFTNAIYQRANLLMEGKLVSKELELNECLIKLNSFIEIIYELKDSIAKKIELESERNGLENSIRITNSPEYSKIVDNITLKSTSKQELEVWRKKIDTLKSEMNVIKEKYDSVYNEADIKNNKSEKNEIAKPYIEAFRKAKTNIESINQLLDLKNFDSLIKMEDEISRELLKYEKELSEMLEKAGLSDENILQIKNAPQRIVKVSEDISNLSKKSIDLQKELDKYEEDFAIALKSKDAYEIIINEAIIPLTQTLEEQSINNKGRDIKQIGLSYYFDTDLAWTHISAHFYKEFSELYKNHEKGEYVRSFMFENRSKFKGTYEEICEFLDKEDSKKGFIKFIKDVFEFKTNYLIFKFFRDQYLNNVRNYKRIQVLYDGKDIERASFGQKCTAVMVILLLFGNYPLIIDEPEAHLDSSLIANYLVPLIKAKKSNRQIIFATHNANFVVNGDSEKIFILNNISGATIITESTIENSKNREELLKLEGGVEAFRNRGDKLFIP